MDKKSNAIHNFLNWLNLYETQYPILRFKEDFYICSEVVETAKKEYKPVVQDLQIGDPVIIDLAYNNRLVVKSKSNQAFGYLNVYMSEPIYELIQAQGAYISNAKIISLTLPTPPQKKTLIYIGFWLTQKEPINNELSVTSKSQLKEELFEKFKKFLKDNFIYKHDENHELASHYYSVNHATNTITISCFIRNENGEIIKAEKEGIANAHISCNARLTAPYSITIARNEKNIGHPITDLSKRKNLSQFLVFLLLLKHMEILNCNIVNHNGYSIALIDLKCFFDIPNDFSAHYEYVMTPVPALPESKFTIDNMKNINCVIRGVEHDIYKARQIILDHIANTWDSAATRWGNIEDGLNANIKTISLSGVLELRIQYLLDDICYHKIATTVPGLKILMFAQDNQWNIYRLYSPSGVNGFTKKELIGQIDKYSETSWALENGPDETFCTHVSFIQTGDSITIKYSLSPAIKNDWNGYKYVVNQNGQYQMITDIKTIHA